MERPILSLRTYYDLLKDRGLLASPEVPGEEWLSRSVTQVSCDSQRVVPGALFICKGAAFKGKYLGDAICKGAFAYVSEHAYPEGAGALHIPVTDIRTAMGLLADLAHGHPSAKLNITGITGTKGKTTTAYYLKSILDAWREDRGERETAILSTIVTDDGLERRPAKLTTPEPLDLQRHLLNAVTAGVDYVTMEFSSQALKYGRVIGVDLACAVFLNIGEDHISPIEHPDWADYFASKLLIFRQARTACVNLDCDHAQEVRSAAGACPRVLTFSHQDPSADIYAWGIRKEGEHIRFSVRTPRYQRELELGMPGLFNVENALAAIAVAEVYGLSPEAVARGLARSAVPGRMEHYVSRDKQVSVIVDYAHNGMSLEALLRSARTEYPDRSLTLLFGCTGGKGIDRREGMGSAAGAFADRIILTEDDPGPEAVVDICADIQRYLDPFGKVGEVIPDREEAVYRAILDCTGPTVVVLAGKGCEMAQKRANGPEPCVPDGLLAQRALERYDGR